MGHLNHLKQFLLALGIPGLFLIAFLDSAVVPLPGGPDAVVLLLSWQSPMQVAWIVLVAATGSTVGCLVFYQIGRASGELALARFKPEKQKWVKARINGNAFWAVLVAMVAPPPFPTKLVILAAGVFHMRMRRFAIGAFVGRLLRYSVEGYLGARFGDQAAQVLKKQYPLISLVLIGCVMLFLLIRRVRRPGESGIDLQTSPQRDKLRN